MKVTVEVPEGHNVKIVKEENQTEKKFEFEGEIFVPGDVIINPNKGGGSMMILSEIREISLLPFLPAIKVPFGLVAYVPSNDEGNRVFVKLTPEAGIGDMKGFRKATEEEKAKMLAALKEEKHYSFDFEKLQPEYIVWNDNDKNVEVVGILDNIDDPNVDYPYEINDNTLYNNCIKFISEQQYKNLIDGKE